jgi:penicillin-binding protein 1A
MNSILKDVAKYGTGARAWRDLHRSDVAGKTGTTNDAKDVWFDGYTPDLVTVAWVGYDKPKSLGRQYGATLALPIWLDFMRVALAKYPERQLPMPTGIVSEAGGTWKGDTEYYYQGSIIGRHDASGTLDADNPEVVNASEPVAIPVGASEASAPVTAAAAPAAAVDNSSKVSDINDIIKNIQD